MGTPTTFVSVTGPQTRWTQLSAMAPAIAEVNRPAQRGHRHAQWPTLAAVDEITGEPFHSKFRECPRVFDPRIAVGREARTLVNRKRFKVLRWPLAQRSHPSGSCPVLSKWSFPSKMKCDESSVTILSSTPPAKPGCISFTALPLRQIRFDSR